MKVFEHLLLTLLPFLMTCVFSYVLGSFIATSFNPADWETNLREFMAIMGIIWGQALWFNFKSKGVYDGYL